MKALVGIDGSERSYHALRYVSKLLDARCDDLLLYFSPPKFRLSSKSALPAEVVDIANKALVETVFGRAMNQLDPALQHITRTIRGETTPAAGILTAADNEDADLIVVGAHGAVRTLSFFLGGTARQVVHHATRPVLVVRGEQELESDKMKILLACDQQQRWQVAAHALRDFSWPSQTKVTMFHVVESLDEAHVRSLLEDGDPANSHARQLARDYQQRLAENKASYIKEMKSTREGFPSLVREADVDVAQGHAVDQIVSKAEGDESDLVVVGARKLGPVGRLLGSTTEALLVRCPCSLLVVHEPAKA